MPVAVACRCGKRFAAPDHLLGKQVPCPVCGQPIAIPKSAAPGRPPAPAAKQPAAHVQSEPGVRINCRCGMSSTAPAALRGQTARCPGCGDLIRVPAVGTDVLPVSPAPNPLLGPRVAPPAKSPWLVVALVGGGAAVLLVILVIVLSILSYARTTAVAANQPHRPQPPALRPAPVPSNLPTSPAGPPPPPATNPFSPAPPPPPPAPTSAPAAGSAPEPDVRPTGKGLGGQDSDVELAKLPEGVQSWYDQPNAKLTGLRRVGAAETPTTHYSWLTGLLPFLGHGRTYERINFTQRLTEGSNLQVGATIIPEFLNPLDARQRWKGYPLDGFALTHFVGMSGVEDARNVVAAKLPRSDPRAGVFGYDEVARPEQITDGASQTIMVVGSGELANPWIFGGGATIRGARAPYFDKTSGLTTQNLPGGGTLAIMADGSVRQISDKIDPAVFQALCTIHGKETADLQKDTQPFDWGALKK